MQLCMDLLCSVVVCSRAYTANWCSDPSFRLSLAPLHVYEFDVVQPPVINGLVHLIVLADAGFEVRKSLQQDRRALVSLNVIADSRGQAQSTKKMSHNLRSSHFSLQLHSFTMREMD